MPLILLFALVPLTEAFILLKVSASLGFLSTLLLVLFTAALGATLAKSQGLGILQELRDKQNRGEMPGDTLFEGLMVLLAAIVLMLPGLVSDVFGFSLLVPPVRKFVIKKVREILKSKGFQERKEPGVEYEILDD